MSNDASGVDRAPPVLAVGVDVVDLTSPRARERSGDDRLLDRVFTAAERERIRSSSTPGREMWVLWAAKEAAFKVLSKLPEGIPVFRHSAFEVTDPPGAPVSSLRYEEFRVELGVDVDAERVMVWAWNGASPEILVARSTVQDALALLDLAPEEDGWDDGFFQPDERDAIHSVPSALVRILARRDASRMLAVAEERLSIVCPPGDPGRRPPYLHLDGVGVQEVDLSLSHDGRELAWAVRLRSHRRG